jgi:hypothetical protein
MTKTKTTTGPQYLIHRALKNTRILSLLREIRRLEADGRHVESEGCRRSLDDLAYGWIDATTPRYTDDDVTAAAREVL